LVHLYQIAALFTVPKTHLLSNASTQLMLLIARPTKMTALLLSVEIQFMMLTQHVSNLMHWLNAKPMRLIAPLPPAQLLPVKLLQIVKFSTANPMPPIAPMLSVRPPLAKLYQIANAAPHKLVKLNVSIQVTLLIAKSLQNSVLQAFAVIRFSQPIQHAMPTSASMFLLLLAALQSVKVTLQKDQLIIGIIAKYSLLKKRSLKSISYHWILPKVMV
jgi:hypothetical protein